MRVPTPAARLFSTTAILAIVPAYSTAWTSTQTGYLTGTGSPVEIRLDINQKRWQLTFNGINLNGATNSIANGTQIARDKTNDSDDKRLIFGYWDSAWERLSGSTVYTSWNNTWSPFTKSIFTAATGAISQQDRLRRDGSSLCDCQRSQSSRPLSPPGPDTVYATGTNGAVRLSWTASTGATSYNVKRSGTSGTGYTTIATGTALSYVDTGRHQWDHLLLCRDCPDSQWRKRKRPGGAGDSRRQFAHC